MSQDPDKTAALTEAELREELAATEARRLQEEEAKAEANIAAAVEEEAKKERERREAEERAAKAAAEAQRAREQAAGAAEPAPTPLSAPVEEGPERPELYVAAAFAGAFLFARILKKIAD
jgi:translation initiation factor IF-2